MRHVLLRPLRALWRLAVAGLIGCAGAVPVVHAQAAQGAAPTAWPSQPITLVVPFAAAGPTDAMARQLAAVLSRALRGRIVVETIGGAGGLRGATHVARARPDGYTLLLHHAGLALAPLATARPALDPLADLAAIGTIGAVPMTLVGRKDLPDDYAAVTRWLRERGADARLGHAGIGSASYLCGAQIAQAAGASPMPVVYKGTSRALADLRQGKVDLLCDQTLNTAEAIRADRVRAYWVAAPRPVPALARVPLARDVGAAGTGDALWYGLFAPAGTPPAVVERLGRALQETLAARALHAALEPYGVELAAPAQATAAALRERLAADVQRWRAAPPRWGRVGE